MKPCRNQKGFTLVELMVTVAVVAILLKLIGWGLGGATAEEDVRTAARRLETVIQEGKALAYEKGVTHSLIFNPNKREYKLFRDDNGDGQRDPGEPWIRVESLSSRVTISSNTFPVNGAGWRVLSIGNDGRPNGTLGTVTFQSSGNVSATVSVNILGRVYVQ